MQVEARPEDRLSKLEFWTEQLLEEQERTYGLLKSIGDRLAVPVQPQSLDEIAAVLKPVTAQEIADSLGPLLAQATDKTEVVEMLNAVRDAVEKVRYPEQSKGWIQTAIKVNNKRTDPVLVEITNPQDISAGGGSDPVITGTQAGPASYSAGGFVIDVTDNYSTVSFGLVGVTVVGPNLPPCHFEYALNTPTAGKFTVKVMRHRYDKATATATGTPGGLPSGVTTRATSGGRASGVDAVGGTGIAVHENELYSHTHSVSLTQTATDAASTELAAGVDLSGTTFEWMAVGT